MARAAKNYLRTSKHAQAHIDIMYAIMEKRVRFDGINWTLRNEDGDWVANITWNINQLAKRGLILLVPQSMMYNMGTKAALLSLAGSDALKDAGALRPGKLIRSDFEPGTSVSWEARVEAVGGLWYVIYRNGTRHSRHNSAAKMWDVYRTHCPNQTNTEEIGR